jgi:hypothetical protein
MVRDILDYRKHNDINRNERNEKKEERKESGKVYTSAC